MWKTGIKNFYLVHSWIFCPKWWYAKIKILRTIHRKELSGKEKFVISHKTLHKKMKFSIKEFSSKYDQIRSSHLLKKSLMENFIFCAVKRLFSFTYLKSTLKEIWKSTYVFVFIQKQYFERFAFLISRIFVLFTREVWIF